MADFSFLFFEGGVTNTGDPLPDRPGRRRNLEVAGKSPELALVSRKASASCCTREANKPRPRHDQDGSVSREMPRRRGFETRPRPRACRGRGRDQDHRCQRNITTKRNKCIFFFVSSSFLRHDATPASPDCGTAAFLFGRAAFDTLLLCQVV